jgi:hypothetical protein
MPVNRLKYWVWLTPFLYSLTYSYSNSYILKENSVSRIYGTCWYDYGQEGIHDPFDMPMKNIRVYLLDSFDQILDSSRTDLSGKYQFEDIPAGAYYKIWFVPGLEFFTTTKNGSGYPHNDSDVNPDGRSDLFRISENQSKQIDAGFIFICSPKTTDFQLSYLSPGCTGKKMKYIQLQCAAFPEIPPAYKLVFILAGGFHQKILQISETADFQIYSQGIYNVYQLIYSIQPDDYNYFDLSFVQIGKTTINELSSGFLKQQRCMSISSKPFGFFYNDCMEITGRVWLDQNKNGKLDPSEAFILNHKIYLLDESGNKLDSTFTNKSGRYSFDELNSLSKYQIQVSPKLHYQFTKSKATDNDLYDSDVSENGISKLIYAAAGSTNSIDAGFIFNSVRYPEIPGDTNELDKNVVSEFQKNKDEEYKFSYASDHHRIAIYPMPFKDQLKFATGSELLNNPWIRYLIYNHSGQIVLNGIIDIPNSCLDVSMLPEGFYVFQWHTEKDYGMIKIIKSRTSF